MKIQKDNIPRLKYSKVKGKKYFYIYKNHKIDGKNKVQILKTLGAIPEKMATEELKKFIEPKTENLRFHEAEKMHRDNYHNRTGVVHSESTMKHYIRSIEPALRFFKFDRVESIDYHLIEKYKDHLLKRGIENRTINIYLTALRKVMIFCLKMKMISSLPIIERLPEYKKGSEDIEYKDGKELATLLHYARPHQALALQFMFYTGLRGTEFVRLTRDRINLSKRTIYIKNENHFNKGNKKLVLFNKQKGKRIILINENAMPVIEELCKDKEPEDRICPFASTDTMRNSFHSLSKKANVRLLPKILRSTFATSEAEAGTDILVLSKKLGHKNVSTTMLYAAVTNKSLRKHRDNLSLEKVLGQ